MANFCKNCGQESSSGGKFCVQCGTPIDQSGSTSAGSSSNVNNISNRARKPKRNAAGLILAFVAVVAIAIGGVWFSNYQAEVRAQEEAAAEAARFEAKQREVVNVLPGAVKQCGIDEPGFLNGFEVDATSLTMDGEGEDDFWGAQYSEIVCVLDELGMPASTKARWSSTRALDGQLDGSWSGPGDDWTINAFWSFHPDSGPDVILELESEYLEGYVPQSDEESEQS